ncbi:hypothetical protein HPB48_008599 [Haemaphysalis longicornis]|uniref:HAP1 N-terminal domain-containing protein n=1 Tax=Haemaphysalis longicornis TaxID=44386 RepID=A0A9J6GRP9_HAELO|nr:hypothetical protein HPB48_008599 [Haemaphysalis longicornis]
MCACRLEGMMQPSSGASQSPMLGELEDYLHEIRGRDVVADDDEADAGDVYSQLAQKEKDLLLAAEIGKELLERNSDLSRQNERLTEEYSRKLESARGPDACTSLRTFGGGPVAISACSAPVFCIRQRGAPAEGADRAPLGRQWGSGQATHAGWLAVRVQTVLQTSSRARSRDGATLALLRRRRMTEDRGQIGRREKSRPGACSPGKSGRKRKASTEPGSPGGGRAVKKGSGR